MYNWVPSIFFIFGGLVYERFHLHAMCPNANKANMEIIDKYEDKCE